MIRQNNNTPFSQRQLRVGELIKQSLGQIFLKDEAKVPILETKNITVTEVRMSPDLKNARAYVIPLGGKDTENAVNILTEFSHLIRKALSKKIDMKFLPKVSFVSDKSFDYAVLSQTLQAFLFPDEVLKQLLRIGKQTIVSIPNFGYWKVRLHLLLKGTMPITKNLPNEWYNTPNLHMCTIQDFVNFCKEKNIIINRSLCLTNEKTSEITNSNMFYKNIFSQLGIFLIQ